MRTFCQCTFLSTLLFAAGCHSIAGTWKVEPGQAAGSIAFGTMTLASDGTFTAEAKYDGETRVVSGHYYRSKGEITFEANGKVRNYGAHLVDDELTITHENKSVKMRRVRPRKRSFWQ